MRCLYCGKPLPLLKKLTGGGEFCSDAHRHKYQEEYNKLALSRLLQAQSSPGDAGMFGGPGNGGGGLRQLAAPAPPPPANAPRALPAPAAQAAPPPLQTAPGRMAPLAPPTPPEPPPAARPRLEAAPPPPPPVRQMPDPKEAPFAIRQHAPIGPVIPPGMKTGAPLPEFEAVKPQLLWSDAPAFAFIPFDWDTAVPPPVVENQEPDPPEARAWRHPQEIHTPPAPRPPAEFLQAFEAFVTKPLYPILRDVTPTARQPLPLQDKISIATRAPLPLLAAEVRLTGTRDWELKLSAPPWRPSLSPVSAPVPPPPRPAVAAPVAPAAKAAPVKAASKPTPAPAPPAKEQSKQQPAHHVDVFIDLSMFGILEGGSEKRK